MRKIIIISAIIACFAAGGALFADSKKDVSDPVLNEIIQSFGPRMPRFIDKHGKELFVTDEPLTRGGLMMALYEYDKSLKATKKDSATITRTEFDQLSSRLNLLETGADKRVRGQEDSAKAPLDTTQIINDLMPNMPMLLDNSLNNSKVFAGLRDEIRGRTPPQADDTLALSLNQTKNELHELEKKVELLEKAPAPQASVGAAAADQTPLYMKKELSLTRAQLSKLEKKVDEIESSRDTQRIAAAPRADSEDVKGYTSMLAKVSMGLSMVAALFIAR